MLTDADRYVLTYLEPMASQIPSETLESLQNKLNMYAIDNFPPDENGKKNVRVRTGGLF